MNTPDVNALLLRPAGLPEVPDAKKIREDYKRGREMIRLTNVFKQPMFLYINRYLIIILIFIYNYVFISKK